MAQFNKTVITNKGLNAIAKAVSNNDIIKFTKFKISDTKYKYNDLINLSDVSSKSTIDVEKVSIMDDETVELYSILSNKNIEAGFYIETIGLFAIDSNGNEYLYSVTTAEVADYLPKYEGVSIANIYICLCIKVGQSEVVSVQTVMKGFVNDDEFQIHKDSDNTRYNEFKTHVIQDDQRYGEYKTHVVQDNQRYDEYKTHVAQDNQRYDEYKAHVTQDDQRYDEYKSHVIKDNQRYDEYKAHALQDDQRYNAHVTQDNQRYDEYKAHVAQDNQR